MKFVRLVLLLFLIDLVCLSYAFFIERVNLKIEKIDIRSPKFPATFGGLRIVHISDLHINAISSYEMKVARQINLCQPDIIAITGDFFKHRNVFEGSNAINELPRNIDQIETFLKLLKARHGIFLCRGNNDFSNDILVSDLFLERMRQVHVKMLINADSIVCQDSQRIHLLGIDFPGFSKWEANEFTNGTNEKGRCLESGFSFKNSYSHVLLGNDRANWCDYTYSGRFRQSNPAEGGIGFTFYSQFDLGYDRFYRLRRLAGWSKFVLSPHGAKMPIGVTEFNRDIQAGRWYRFKIRCFSEAGNTRMQARIWPEGSAEPDNWQVDAVDTTQKFQTGTVGVWSQGKGAHQFDDLALVDAHGDTLLCENFEDGDTFGWVDYNFEGKAIPWLKHTIPDSEFSILLAHTPDLIRLADSAKIDLQLSGHTHGGQVQLPFWGPILTGTRLGRKYAEGLYPFEHTTLYVNRGIGTILLPIRFLCRPEITVIDLKAE